MTEVVSHSPIVSLPRTYMGLPCGRPFWPYIDDAGPWSSHHQENCSSYQKFWFKSLSPCQTLSFVPVKLSADLPQSLWKNTASAKSRSRRAFDETNPTSSSQASETSSHLARIKSRTVPRSISPACQTSFGAAPTHLDRMRGWNDCAS